MVFVDLTEGALAALYGSVDGDEWAKRIYVASRFGYMDAKVMRYLHETFGMHVADQIVALRKNVKSRHLRIPWIGLRHEFLTMGMKESAVEAMLSEAREFDGRAEG